MSDARKDPGYVADIVESAKLVGRYTHGKTAAEFAADQELIDAVSRRLTIIGEAAKCLTDAYRKDHPEIEWNKIARMRDLLTHHYRKIDVATLWDAARNHVPGLLALGA